ncbi:hypothetical protein [Aliiglaciecola lipolytica]|uniref:hypothetical protein n=1 Tax=Aliiglaciecola lipolytica TaxID=477689 RepID=UPI00030C5E28|nr:hypothetical protein [Aliiglaciecola lipolytica]
MKNKKPTLIDHNLLAIHKRIGEKLLQNPNLIEKVEDKLETRFKSNLIYRSIYLDWWAVLELKDDINSLVAQLCVQSEQMNKLRRYSPFVGILSESEREAFFNQLENNDNI